MKLVCPHCSKVIDVDDHLAGQTTNCPQCEGPFTVPLAPPAPPVNSASTFPPRTPSVPLPPLPPPPPSPPAPDPLAQTADWSRDEHVVPPTSPARGAAARGVDRLLRGFRTITIPPAVREWLGVGTLVFLFFLMFFPWVTISAGETRLITQSGAGIAFGTVGGAPEAASLARDMGLGTSPLLVLYFLCVLAGLLLLIVLLVERFAAGDALGKLRPTLERIAEIRDTIVLGLLVLTALILLLHVIGISFPVEQIMQSERAADVMRLGLKAKVTPTIDKINDWDMVYYQWLRRTRWFCFATLVNVIAAGYGLVKWLKYKGYIRRLPRLVMQEIESDPPSEASPQLAFDSPMARNRS